VKINVLEHGHVELIDYMGSDLTVANSARVSFANESQWEEYDGDGNGMLGDKDEKLIRYLAKHNHWTPFAHPQITLRIKAPVPIRTQFFKHKQGFVENEISRRYVSFEPEFYHPQWRGKPTGSAKQGSEDFIELSNRLQTEYEVVLHNAIGTYNALIEEGVAPEQARMVLPQSTMTEWYWSGSLDAFADMCNLRCKPDTQAETRFVADAISEEMEKLFPVSWEALLS